MKLFDVVVVGGGSAGVSAAIASARNGASTLLLERSSRLGGNVAHGLVHSICGLYEIAQGPVPRLANGGFALEFAQTLISERGAIGPLRMGRLDVLLQEPSHFAEVCADLVHRTKGVEILMGAEVSAVEVRQGRIRSLSVKGGVHGIQAKSVVDATGDSIIATAAGVGVDCAPAKYLQRPAYIFGISNLKKEVFEDASRLKLVALLSNAIREERIPKALAGAALRPSCSGGRGRVTIDLEAFGEAYRPADEAQMRSIYLDAQKLGEAFLGFVRERVSGFEEAEIFELPARIGVRESARLRGRYQITSDDVLKSATFEDAVCMSAWPVEMRETNTGPRLKYPETGRPCEVPLRALMSRDISNLLAAGRCISCTHEAHAALRVIGTCLATGEAAGMAASEIARLPEGRIDATALVSLAERIKSKTSFNKSQILRAL